MVFAWKCISEENRKFCSCVYACNWKAHINGTFAWIAYCCIESAPGEVVLGEDGKPIEGAAPPQIGEDGQPIVAAAEAAAPEPEPEVNDKHALCSLFPILFLLITYIDGHTGYICIATKAQRSTATIWV